MWCDPNNGCQKDKYACPEGTCCQDTNVYVSRSCTSLGYPSSYQCCDNLDARTGVGLCKETCIVCNNNGICDSSIGETTQNCGDCKSNDCDFDEICDRDSGENEANVWIAVTRNSSAMIVSIG